VHHSGKVQYYAFVIGYFANIGAHVLVAGELRLSQYYAFLSVAITALLLL